MTTFWTCLCGALLAPALAALGIAGQPAAAATFDEGQTKAIEKIVRDYLLKNPEILVDVQEALNTKRLNDAISENSKAIFRSKYSFVAGNPKGDVTVVEFADYNCGICKQSLSAVMKLIETDKNVRVVIKELPIFGREPSIEAARVAVAAIKQGKYLELHNALMKSRGRVDKSTALAAARKLGLDVEKLEADMSDPEIEAAIGESFTLARALGVEGTPFFLVGDKAIPGGYPNLYDLFVQYVADVRKNGCTATC